MNSELSVQYIYGVIPATAQLSAVVGSPLADDHRAPARFADSARRARVLHTDKLPDDEIIGHGGLRVVAYEDIAAVTDQASPVDIKKMRKDELARLLVGHQKVIEAVMQSGATVIPFRLGTWANSEAEVMDILVKGGRLIRRVFAEVNGKIEMDVVATWADFAAVLKEVSEDDEIKKSKTALGANSRGVSVDDRLKIGLMIKATLDHKRLAISRQISARLASVACAQSWHDNMDDQMVMNGAFLIELARRSEFERMLDELNNQFANKLNFRCVGPLPPYSFYTLELKKIEWEDVDWACQIMNLSAAASAEEIKKAFQQSALATHPDHCGESAEAERSFNELNGARRIIMEYAQACEQTGKADQLVFSEENVWQNSLLVKVRNGGSM